MDGEYIHKVKVSNSTVIYIIPHEATRSRKAAPQKNDTASSLQKQENLRLIHRKYDWLIGRKVVSDSYGAGTVSSLEATNDGFPMICVHFYQKSSTVYRKLNYLYVTKNHLLRVVGPTPQKASFSQLINYLDCFKYDFTNACITIKPDETDAEELYTALLCKDEFLDQPNGLPYVLKKDCLDIAISIVSEMSDAQRRELRTPMGRRDFHIQEGITIRKKYLSNALFKNMDDIELTREVERFVEQILPIE